MMTITSRNSQIPDLEKKKEEFADNIGFGLFASALPVSGAFVGGVYGYNQGVSHLENYPFKEDVSDFKENLIIAANTTIGSSLGIVLGGVTLAAIYVLSRKQHILARKTKQFFDYSAQQCMSVGEKIADIRYPINKTKNPTT